MKTVTKKLLCLMLVAMMLVSAIPTALAAAGDPCRITFSPYAGSEDLSADKFTALLEEGSVITAAQVKELANQKWAGKYEFVSCLLGDEGTIAMPGTTIPVEVKKIQAPAPTEPAPTEPAPTEPAPTEPAKPGDLIVYAYTKTEDTEYVNFNYGQPVIIEGAADASLDKAMAEKVIGKQVTSYKWLGATKDDKGNVTVQLNVTIMETKDNKNVYQLRIMFNRGNGNDDYKQIDIYEGEGILQAIKNAGIKPTYEDHVLVGYTSNHTGTAKTYLTIYDVADASKANAQGVIKIFADWREVTDDDDEDFEYGNNGGLYGDDNEDPIYDVVLYIYTNGKTSSYAKKVDASAMGIYTKDGKLTRDEVQLVVERYFKTNKNTQYYGLFNKYYWNSGNYLTENAVSSIELDAKETNYVYVMVKDASLRVADSSNPQTGDAITVAATTMVLAAAALVTMTELKKRKMI